MPTTSEERNSFPEVPTIRRKLQILCYRMNILHVGVVGIFYDTLDIRSYPLCIFIWFILSAYFQRKQLGLKLSLWNKVSANILLMFTLRTHLVGIKEQTSHRTSHSLLLDFSLRSMSEFFLRIRHYFIYSSLL